MERTLVIIKPDGVQRQLIGRIITRLEEKGLKIIGLKMVEVKPAQAEKLYAIHRKKGFYQGLIKFITAAPVVVLVIEAREAVSICRKLLGATFGVDAEPGTIRGDFGSGITYNLVHASDSAEISLNEILLFFKDNELLDYKLNTATWIYSPDEKITN